jgi:hypothetical protein
MPPQHFKMVALVQRYFKWRYQWYLIGDTHWWFGQWYYVIDDASDVATEKRRKRWHWYHTCTSITDYDLSIITINGNSTAT